jgi:hypothetical protein
MKPGTQFLPDPHIISEAGLKLLGSVAKVIQLAPHAACEVVGDLEDPRHFEFEDSPISIVLGRHPVMGYTLAVYSGVGSSVALVERLGPTKL